MPAAWILLLRVCNKFSKIELNKAQSADCALISSHIALDAAADSKLCGGQKINCHQNHTGFGTKIQYQTSRRGFKWVWAHLVILEDIHRANLFVLWLSCNTKANFIRKVHCGWSATLNSMNHTLYAIELQVIQLWILYTPACYIWTCCNVQYGRRLLALCV